MAIKKKTAASEESKTIPSRADRYPTDGFSMVVDGKLKSHHATFDAAQSTALDLKTRYPVIQVMVRDDTTTIRTPVELPDDEQ